MHRKIIAIIMIIVINRDVVLYNITVRTVLFLVHRHDMLYLEDEALTLMRLAAVFANAK